MSDLLIQKDMDIDDLRQEGLKLTSLLRVSEDLVYQNGKQMEDLTLEIKRLNEKILALTAQVHNKEGEIRMMYEEVLQQF